MTKQLFLFSTALLLLFTFKDGRSQAFTNGTTSFSGGYGFITFLSTFNNIFDGYDDVSYSQFGPIYLKAERGIADHVGLAINFAYVQNKWGFKFQDYDTLGNIVDYTEADTRTSYSIMGRINFHLGDNEKFDPYLGLGLGYRNSKWKTETNDPYGSSDVSLISLVPLAFELSIGVRYLFTPNFGAYGEIGAAKSVFQFGLVYNLPGVSTPQQKSKNIHP